MPIQTNLNVTPYYDDFDTDKNFNKVLYKAGYPIQARELTQQQSIIQDQLEQFASRIMNDGDAINGGMSRLMAPVSYVILSGFTQGADLKDFVGYTLTGATSGTVATVIWYAEATATDDPVLYISYSTNDTTGEFFAFAEGEVLESSHPDQYTANVGVRAVSKPITEDVLGEGVLFRVAEGSFFANGLIVRSDEQTVVVDKYTARGGLIVDVGFEVVEEFITASDDTSLLDNSQGSSNFAAPGADRLKVTLNLVTRNGVNDRTYPNFVYIASVLSGNIVSRNPESVKWDWLYDLLARRTYDESGDYIVTEFPVSTMEYWNDDNLQQRGLFDIDEDTNLYPYIPGSQEEIDVLNGDATGGLTYAEADDLFVLRIDGGTAYVRGYEQRYTNPTFFYQDKARDTLFRDNSIVQISDGYNLTVTNVYGTPDFANISGDGTSIAFDGLVLYRNFIDGFVGNSVDGNGRPLNLGNAPWKTFHIIADGTIGTDPTGYTEVYKEGNTCVVNTVVDLVRGDAIGDAVILKATEIDPIPAGVFRPRYLNPADQVDQGNGYYGYNSTFDLGVISSVNFTELSIAPALNPATDWVVGSRIYGQSSGASAVVEAGFRGTSGVLVISNALGEFFEGETITQGDKTARIIPSGEIKRLVFTDKGTGNNVVDLSAQTSVTFQTLGQTKTLTVADGHLTAFSDRIEITESGRTEMRNWPSPESVSGGARVDIRLSTNDGVTGYAVSAPAIIRNSLGLSKSFYSALADTNDFSADISVRSSADSNIYDLANGAGFSGSASDNVLTCGNLSGDPSKELLPGDVISFTDDQNEVQQAVVEFVTKPVGFGNNRARARVYLTTSLPNSVTAAGVQRIRTRTKGSPSDNLVYKLPQNVVATLETNTEETDINYSVFREFIVNIPSGTSTVTLTSGKNNETFISSAESTSIVVAENLSNPSDPENLAGRVVVPTSLDITQDDGRKIIYTLNSATTSALKLKVIAPMFVSNATSRRKIARVDQTVTISAADAANRIISLGKADAYKLTSVTVGGKDITDNYTFDNGQRDNFYDLARLVLKRARPVADGEMTVVFSYFEHSGEGDFFTVDSYTSEGTFDYKNIPTYIPSAGYKGSSDSTSANVDVLQLRDCIDFRPTVNTTGSDPSVIAYSDEGNSAQTATNFRGPANGGNGTVTRMPIPQSLFQSDISYYAPRIDSVFLDSKKGLVVVAGDSSLNPTPPSGPTSAIRLYNIHIPAYTFDLKDIYTKKFNYKRYRMKDIATIDKKVQRLEDLVTLTLLEQSAINTDVRDAVTGLDRYKNGIAVDAFRDHAAGDTKNSQYKNSIDPANDYLRPAFHTGQVGLEETLQTKEDRSTSSYAVNNGIMTLDFVDTEYLSQPLATRWINIQPYNVFTYRGELELFPSIDTDVDRNRVPDLVIEDNSLFDAAVNQLAEDGGGVETVWGDWEVAGGAGANADSTNLPAEPRLGLINGAPFRRPTFRPNLTGFGTNGTATPVGRGLQEDPGVAVTQFGPSSIGIEESRNTGVRLNVGGGRGTRGNGNRGGGIGAIPPGSTLIREQTTTTTNIEVVDTTTTSMGDRVVDIQLSRTMRSIAVQYRATNLKPNTRYYGFFDSVNVSDWMTADVKSTDFPDGLARYVGAINSNRGQFGQPLVSDEFGTVQGIFIIPNGRAPLAGTEFQGEMNTIQYRESGPTRSFTSGQRMLRLTDNPANPDDFSLVTGICESTFTSYGLVADVNATIISTRIPGTVVTSEVTATETRVQPPNPPRPNPAPNPIPPGPRPPSWTPDPTPPPGGWENWDPVAQTFTTNNIRSGDHGVFVTTAQVFFRTKDQNEPVRVYLTPTENEKPLNSIIPHSSVSKTPDTTLRVVATGMTGNLIELPAGTRVTGQLSGASGTLSHAISLESAANNPTTNIENTVYNFVIDEYLLDFVENETLSVELETAPAVTLKIARDELQVTRLDLESLGSGYTTATVTFSAPELPGGVAATGEALIAGGFVYAVNLLTPGSGYTKVPTVTISGDGTGATASVRVTEGREAVNMGVCTSADGTAPTLFRFKAPVYLEENQTYALVVKSETSLEYTVWTAKVGENIVGTTTRVATQPFNGSLFMSSNSAIWTADQTQDLTFVLQRAQFNTNVSTTVDLKNVHYEPKKLLIDPIETDHTGLESASSTFGDSPNIVKVHHFHHGLVPGDKVILTGVINNPGGIPNEELNTLHTVLAADFESFTFRTTSAATSTTRDGGSAVYSTYNLPYEVMNVEGAVIEYPEATADFFSNTTQSSAVTGFNQSNNYVQGNRERLFIGRSKYYTKPMKVANEINEASYASSVGDASLDIQATLYSTNDYLSPVIDLQRMKANLVRNLIDNPAPQDAIFGSSERTLVFGGDISGASLIVGSTIEFTTDSETYTVYAKSVNENTNTVVIEGENVSNLAEDSTFTDATLEAAGIELATSVSTGDFVPETNPRGSVYSKWISKVYQFENPCDGIEVKLTALFYDREDIRVYYRPRNVGFDGDLETTNWIPFNGDGLPNDVDKIVPRSSDTVDPTQISPSDWQALTWSTQDVENFDGVAIKIVMTADNPCQAPLIDDMRIICSE